MAPKEVTDVEKRKRKIVMTTVKKKLKSGQTQITLDRLFQKKKKRSNDGSTYCIRLPNCYQ
jgi:hypothetical protein